MLKFRLAKGTNKTYSYAQKAWVQFTNLIGVDNFTRNSEVMHWFVLWRFVECKCKKGTIESNMAAINNLFVLHGHEPEKWKQNNWQLKYILEVVNSVYPPGKGSKPNDEFFIRSIFKYYDFSNITHYSVWCASVLAYCFALRICEYCETTLFTLRFYQISNYVAQKMELLLLFILSPSPRLIN